MTTFDTTTIDLPMADGLIALHLRAYARRIGGADERANWGMPA